ncbi:hypothetical protein BSL78_24227 [Apostichopus japonicus]|uniref:Uncharacterized protein n=1 Tax=Stichopus japonicus TaxID=307972 RepID=A0A2G8JT47_STIJA|nr:hypothetical protein BSL78_24227 [Apostichopus japonicus]
MMGWEWTIPAQHVNATTKVIACACDSVARCQLQGVTQFNGYFGCSWCLHKGKSVEKGRGSVTVYQYEEPVPVLRTQANVEAEAIKITSGEPSSIGVNNVSPLLLIPRFDIVEGFPVDYMHAVCEGVTEKLTNLWFDSSSHKEPWHIGNQKLLFPQVKSQGYQNHHPNGHTGKHQNLDHGSCFKGCVTISLLDSLNATGSCNLDVATGEHCRE